MTTKEIADKLITYCREGKYDECFRELYSPDCVSIEPKGAMFEVCNGLEEMKKKGEAWQEMMEEFHGSDVGDPIVAADHFSCTMMMEATFKGVGRQRMDEICVYKVRDGKVVQEQFFYSMPEQG